MEKNSNTTTNGRGKNAIRKNFELFPLLLVIGAEPQEKRFREFVVRNNDGTFSLFHEKFEVEEKDWVMYREKNNKKYKTTAQLCYEISITPQLLMCLN